MLVESMVYENSSVSLVWAESVTETICSLVIVNLLCWPSCSWSREITDMR